MQVWRIFPSRYRKTAFTGIGGLYAAGRWNHLGVPMVYTATSRALAALEFFVNLDPGEAPANLMIAEAGVPEAFIEWLDVKALPAAWRRPNSEACRDVGSKWAARMRSAALRVSSAVVEGEWNVLLNPKHPDFAKVEIANPKPFRFDERMLR
ncbi:MAG: RES family NAD+ phosphorylase [Terracidiphilus sp.]